MKGVVAAVLVLCALARAQSGDGDGSTGSPDDVIIACPLEDAPDSLVIILRHPTDCSKFYKCDHGLPVEKSCPKGLLFNDELKVCDWPHNVDCGASRPTQAPPAPPTPPTRRPTRPPRRTTTTATTKKPASPAVKCPPDDPQDGEAVLLANPEDPASFFICSWGVPYLQHCAAGLHFSTKSRTCDWPR